MLTHAPHSSTRRISNLAKLFPHLFFDFQLGNSLLPLEITLLWWGLLSLTCPSILRIHSLFKSSVASMIVNRDKQWKRRDAKYQQLWLSGRVLNWGLRGSDSQTTGSARLHGVWLFQTTPGTFSQKDGSLDIPLPGMFFIFCVKQKFIFLILLFNVLTFWV